MQRIQHLLHIIAVFNLNHIIPESQCFGFDIAKTHDFIVCSVDLQSVVVEDNRQVVQLVMRCSHACFPHETFLAFAVADDRIYMAFSAGMSGTQRHTDGNRYSLSEGTG